MCTQELLSKQVESGQAHSIVPSVRAVLCFSISWPTIASTVSVVWTIQRSVSRILARLTSSVTHRNLELAVQVRFLFAED